jgi:small subunit ribosomal protein S6
MRKQTYESVVLINAALEDDQVETTITRIQETITSHGGEIIELDKWGRKRLAYPIKKSKSGYYVVIRFDSTTDLVSTLERNYRLDENIIRYLTIALDKYALEAIAKQKEIQKAETVAVEETTDSKPIESQV